MTGKRRKQQNQMLSLILLLVINFIVLNCVTTGLFYKEYECKMNLLAEVAADTDRLGIDIAVDWMKGNEANPQGKQLLEQYGYWGNKGNAFYVRFLQNVIATAGVTAVMSVVLFFLLCHWKKEELQKQSETLEQLEQMLVRFRENHFEVVLDAEGDYQREKLAYQLEAIGHHIALLREEARAEKESTKEMVSDISHQLKTPVAALDACFSVLLRDNLSAAEQQEFRTRCRSALDGLETLLQSLLQISKMEAGLIQIEKQKSPLMETMIASVNRIYPKADEKQIEITFDGAELMENCEIMQDKKWLGEAFINVLDNAVKYSPECSKVMIRAQKRTGFMRIEIEDSGIGVPKEEYHKIFQRFYRGTLPEVREKSGSGIGLFLSREIIEQHGGTITVASGMEKKGSTFIIQLPDEA